MIYFNFQYEELILNTLSFGWAMGISMKNICLLISFSFKNLKKCIMDIFILLILLKDIFIIQDEIRRRRLAVFEEKKKQLLRK